jgi:hypothetical protein
MDRLQVKSWKNLVTSATFVLTALPLLFASACQQAPTSRSTEDIDTYMASLAGKSVELVKSSYGIALDYSPRSVEDVEKILTTKYDLLKNQPMSEDQFADAANIWGAYIGEVLKRARPAHWEKDSSRGDKGALPIVFNDTHEEAFPCAWVYHRLKNGPEDSVTTKFEFVAHPGGIQKYLKDHSAH